MTRAEVVPLNGSHHWIGPAFEVVPYEATHLRAIRLQPMQAELGPMISQGDLAERVTAAGPAWTVLDHGRPVACCGFYSPWEGRSIAWAVLGDCGPYMLRMTRVARDIFSRSPAQRIECHVKDGFAAAVRWAELIGFKRESLMPRFYGGEDFWCYVILKEPIE